MMWMCEPSSTSRLERPPIDCTRACANSGGLGGYYDLEGTDWLSPLWRHTATYARCP